MRYSMRRSKQLLGSNEVMDIMKRGITVTLGMKGDEEFPYVVPVNYVVEEDHFYFHCARVGHKWDVLQYDPRVSFCVIDQEDIVEEKFTSYFRSVIGFGVASVVVDSDEVIHALRLLVKKYSPSYVVEGEKEIQDHLANVAIVRVDIKEISGKQAIELVGK